MNITVIIVALIAALVGTGTGGSIVAWRKDARQVPIDVAASQKAKLEVTKLVEEMADRAVKRAKQQLEAQEAEAKRLLEEQQVQHARQIGKLNRRIEVLENVMRSNGLTVPSWTI